MSEAAKKAALEKVERMKIKIGYPVQYVDFAECEVDNNYAANILTIYRAQTEHELQFIDMPTDDDMWQSAPQVANMYYMRVKNYIEIPAAMLQPPFFYPDGDDAVNFGAIGAAIGHEITHGFDNAGRFYDKDGNLADWWDDSDSIEFVRRSKKLVNRFNSFVAVDTLHVDGELTLSENIADLGGINIAYTAFSKTAQWRNQNVLTDGLTPDQRFFIAYARTWAGAYRDEFAHSYTLTNEHALGKFRVEGPLPNLSAFVKAFNVKPGDRYYIADSLRTEIW
jgi:putative endopeptidase